MLCTSGVGSKFVNPTDSPIEIELPLVEREIPLMPKSVETDGIDMTMLVFENPMLRAPKASNERAFGSAKDAEETDDVVFPTAYMLRTFGPAGPVTPALP